MQAESSVELSSGKKIVYTINGNMKGEPFVLLHGWCCDPSIFSRLIEKFSPAFLNKYRIILPTHFGHGDSSKPGEKVSYDEILKMCAMTQFAEDVKAFLDKLGITTPIILAGHSMGGAILFTFALKYPNLLKAIIPLGTLVHNEELEKAQFKFLMDGLKSGAVVMDPVVWAQDFIEKVFDRKTAKDPALNKILQDMILKTPGLVWGACIENIMLNYDVLEQVQALKIPTLILHGARDRMTPPPKGEQIKNAMPGSQLVMIPKGSHAFFFEQPEVAAAEIEKFLVQY